MAQNKGPKSTMLRESASSQKTERQSYENKDDTISDEDISTGLCRYLILCKRVVQRMKETGKWPWKTGAPEVD